MVLFFILLLFTTGFSKYKAPLREGLLIQNAMCLPFFLPLTPKLVTQMYVWNKSSLVTLIDMNTVVDGNKLHFGLPIAWLYVILDSVTQVSIYIYIYM